MEAAANVAPIVSPDLTGDHDKFSHYVAADKLAESKATGSPVMAFCGKVWVPNDDPSKYPVCKECSAVLARKSARFSN